MKPHRALFVTAISLVFFSCAAPRSSSRVPQTLSVHELLATPRQFDGQQVVVKGFFLFPMVGDKVLYDTEGDYHHHRSDRSIRLEVDAQKVYLMTYQVKVCFVEGTFHSRSDQETRSSLGEITRFRVDE